MLLRNNYIDQCSEKAVFHKKNADNALKWWNLMGISAVVITSCQALSMTILTVLQVPAVHIAITGAVFALIISILTRVQSAFSFNALSIQHNQLFDDFNELENKFKILDQEGTNDVLYNEYVNRYISCIEKTHIQPVKDCVFLSCCC